MKQLNTLWARLWPTHLPRPGETDADRRARVLTYPPPEGSMTGEPCPQLDLSDTELLTRLTQRGVSVLDAGHLVDRRDRPGDHERIDDLLDG